ncbi:MAG: hypothetical protein DIJKHBIC_04378 [Thermoanaerobaculia bacterium]|nr:hypothetical protein [Thermoanaerobaculia bacterium]
MNGERLDGRSHVPSSLTSRREAFCDYWAAPIPMPPPMPRPPFIIEPMTT